MPLFWNEHDLSSTWTVPVDWIDPPATEPSEIQRLQRSVASGLKRVGNGQFALRLYADRPKGLESFQLVATQLVCTTTIRGVPTDTLISWLSQLDDKYPSAFKLMLHVDGENTPLEESQNTIVVTMKDADIYNSLAMGSLLEEPMNILREKLLSKLGFPEGTMLDKNKKKCSPQSGTKSFDEAKRESDALLLSHVCLVNAKGITLPPPLTNFACPSSLLWQGLVLEWIAAATYRCYGLPSTAIRNLPWAHIHLSDMARTHLPDTGQFVKQYHNASYATAKLLGDSRSNNSGSEFSPATPWHVSESDDMGRITLIQPSVLNEVLTLLHAARDRYEKSTEEPSEHFAKSIRRKIFNLLCETNLLEDALRAFPVSVSHQSSLVEIAKAEVCLWDLLKEPDGTSASPHGAIAPLRLASSFAITLAKYYAQHGDAKSGDSLLEKVYVRLQRLLQTGEDDHYSYSRSQTCILLGCYVCEYLCFVSLYNGATKLPGRFYGRVLTCLCESSVLSWHSLALQLVQWLEQLSDRVLLNEETSATPFDQPISLQPLPLDPHLAPVVHRLSSGLLIQGGPPPTYTVDGSQKIESTDHVVFADSPFQVCAWIRNPFPFRIDVAKIRFNSSVACDIWCFPCELDAFESNHVRLKLRLHSEGKIQLEPTNIKWRRATYSETLLPFLSSPLRASQILHLSVFPALPLLSCMSLETNKGESTRVINPETNQLEDHVRVPSSNQVITLSLKLCNGTRIPARLHAITIKPLSSAYQHYSTPRLTNDLNLLDHTGANTVVNPCSTTIVAVPLTTITPGLIRIHMAYTRDGLTVTTPTLQTPLKSTGNKVIDALLPMRSLCQDVQLSVEDVEEFKDMQHVPQLNIAHYQQQQQPSDNDESLIWQSLTYAEMTPVTFHSATLHVGQVSSLLFQFTISSPEESVDGISWELWPETPKELCILGPCQYHCQPLASKQEVQLLTLCEGEHVLWISIGNKGKVALRLLSKRD